MIIFKATALFADVNARKYESTLSEFRYRAMTNFRSSKLVNTDKYIRNFSVYQLNTSLGVCETSVRSVIAEISQVFDTNWWKQNFPQTFTTIVERKRVKLSSKLSDVSATVTKYRNTTKTQSHR